MTIEVISYTVSALYNFTNSYRLMNYFEYVILIVQNYILIAIVLFFRQQINRKTVIICSAYFSLIFLFSYAILPKSLLTLMIVSHRVGKVKKVF